MQWECRCECGWSKTYRNPVAAQWGGESHTFSGRCPFYLEALKILKGEKKYMPDRNKYFDSANFLKADDIKDGQLVTIEKFDEAKTRIGTRPILRFEKIEQPFGLNATNFDKMLEKFGDNEAKWSGKKVRLRIVQAPNPSKGGKIGPAIRIE